MWHGHDLPSVMIITGSCWQSFCSVWNTVMTNSWPPGPESQDIHSIMPQTFITKRKQISLFLRNNSCRPRSVLFPFFSTICYLNLNIDSDIQRLLKKHIVFFQISHIIPTQDPATAWSAPWLTADSGRWLTGSLGWRRSSATSSTACPPPSDKAAHTHQHFILVIVFQKIIINLKLWGTSHINWMYFNSMW